MWLPDRQHRKRGNTFVEFALSAALLVPVLTGCFQFGYALYVYNQLQTAVRAGARLASLKTYDSLTSTPTAAFRTSVANMVVYGNPSGGSQPVVAGLTTANVSVTMHFESGTPRAVTVSVSNFSVDTIVKRINLVNKPRMKLAFMGRVDPGA